MPLQKWMFVSVCVCVSQSCKSYNPRSETAFIMLFWLNMDCGCLFCLFQAGFVMFCGLGSPLDWPGSSLILCVLFQFSSSQNPQSTRFCHEIRVAIPEMQSTKPEMHMKWYEMGHRCIRKLFRLDSETCIRKLSRWIRKLFRLDSKTFPIVFGNFCILATCLWKLSRWIRKLSRWIRKLSHWIRKLPNWIWLVHGSTD